MRINEIEVGVDYAQTRRGYVTRVRVVKVGEFKETVYSGSRDYRGHLATKKGAFVVAIDRRTGEPATRTERTTVPAVADMAQILTGTVPEDEVVETVVPAPSFWVASRELASTWSAYCEANERQESAKAAREDRFARVEAAAKAKGVDIYISRYTSGDGRLISGDARVGVRQLEQLLGLS